MAVLVDARRSLLKPGFPVVLVGIAIVLGLSILAVQIELLILLWSSSVVLFSSLWLMQRTIRVLDFRRLTIPAFWYYSYLSMIWIPAFLIFFKVTPYGYAYQIQPGPHLYTFLFAAQSILITVPLGIFLTNKLLHFEKDEIERYFGRSPQQGSSVSPVSYSLFLSGAIALTLYYFFEVRQLPVLEMFRDPGDFRYLTKLRQESFSALESPFVYAYSVLREVVYPFLIAVSFGCYLHTRRAIWLFLFITTLIIGLLYASTSIARGPVATMFLVLAFCYYLWKPAKLSLRNVMLTLAFIFSFPVAVTILTRSGWTLLDALKAIGIRLFYLPSYVAHLYFELIPFEVGYQYGATSGKLAWLFGMEYFNIGQYVLLRIYPNAPLSGNAGGAFFADFYANFGIPGVLFGGVLFGVIMQGLQILLLRQEKSIASIAVYAFLFYAFWMTTSRHLQTVLLSTGVLFVLLFWWTLAIGDEILKRARSKTYA